MFPFTVSFNIVVLCTWPFSHSQWSWNATIQIWIFNNFSCTYDYQGVVLGKISDMVVVWVKIKFLSDTDIGEKI